MLATIHFLRPRPDDRRSSSIVSLTEMKWDLLLVQFQGFTATQIGYFSVTQAAVITVAQFQSLDADKQAVIGNILMSVQSDLAANPASQGAGQKSGSLTETIG